MTELTPAHVEARLRWARRNGRPHYLWPDVPPAAWRAALTAIGNVAGALLSGQPHATLRLDGGDQTRLRALGVAAFTSGMGPLLGLWVEQERLGADGAVRALLARHLAHGRARAQRMHDALRNAVRVLDEAGVRAIVLKGAHTAHACLPEPGVRPMADLDLLISAKQTSRAEAVLSVAGYSAVQGGRMAQPYRSVWRPPDAPETLRSLSVHHADNPFNVDLHASLDLNFFGVAWVRFGDLDPSQLRSAPWAGERAAALPEPLLVAHLAAHTSQGLYNLTLIRLAELALVLRRVNDRGFDWRELTRLLQRARAERFVYPAFALVERLVPGTVDAALLERVTRAATPALRGVVGAVLPATAQRLDTLSLNERFMWAATPLERARRVAHMLWPTGPRGSVRRLHRIYAERAFRLLRGRVTLRE